MLLSSISGHSTATMIQNVKYDSLTGKVYEELGCPSKSNNKANENDSPKTEQDKNVNKNDSCEQQLKETEQQQQQQQHMTQNDPRSNSTTDYSHHYSSYHDLSYYNQQMDHSFIGSNCFGGTSYQPTTSHQFNPYDR